MKCLLFTKILITIAICFPPHSKSRAEEPQDSSTNSVQMYSTPKMNSPSGYGGFGSGMGMGMGMAENIRAPTGMFGWPKGIHGQQYDPKNFPAGYEPGKSTPSEMGSKLRGLIRNLPDENLRNGITKYLDIISLESYTTSSVGLSNKGLASYLEKTFSEGECFQTLAQGFYNELAKRDESSRSNWENLRLAPLRDRPSLADVAGASPHGDVNKGWLWQTAMRHTNNNSNLAMALIAMCGHDDTSQGAYVWLDKSEAAKSELRDIITENSTIIKHYQKRIVSLVGDNREINDIAEMLGYLTNMNTMLKMQNGISRALTCPRNSSKMFLPESLGPGEDITQNLKNKISSIQAPSQGKSSLPAKHYHVYGGAFMACQLIAEGVDPKETIFLQKQAARFYRGLRMCEVSRQYENQRQVAIKQYDKYKKNVQTNKTQKNTRRGTRAVNNTLLGIEQFFTQESLRLSKSGQCIAPKYPTFEGNTEGGKIGLSPENEKKIEEHQNALLAWHNEFGELCHTLSMTIGISLYEPDIDENMIKDKVAIAFGKMNAGYLYQKWYLGGGKPFGVNIPCTDFRLFGPSSLTGSERTSRGHRGGRCVPEFSSESCREAKQRLATWDVDFEWTIAQHEAGAKFAAKNCKKNEKNLSINQMACETTDAQQNRRQSPPQERAR